MRLYDLPDERAKNHLNLLCSTLAKHPDAKPLLEKLNAWLKQKSRDTGAACNRDR
jgi:hypothetical protein